MLPERDSATAEAPIVPRTPREVSEILVRAYPHCGGLVRQMIRWRPYICPFHDLLGHLPSGGSILEVGCGVGVMTVLLAHLRRFERMVGIDASETVIETARRAVMPKGTSVSFEHVRDDAWPDEHFDHVVSIDVLHHVPRERQREFVQRLARTAAGGAVVFKDVSPRPRWKAWAAHAHDALINRETIHIRDENEVADWFREAGMEIREQRRMDMACYSHYMIVGQS